MHGEIKLKTWRTFGADETLTWNQEMMWRARTSMNGLPISGYDRVAPGTGEQRWKLLGLDSLGVSRPGREVVLPGSRPRAGRVHGARRTRGPRAHPGVRRTDGSDRFEREGEFIRIVIDDAHYE